MNNQLPLVTICIPTYNAAETIYEMLASILAQSYTNLVIHISDNASTDSTIKMIESVADDRVHIHRQNQNIGAEGNFNRCIQLAEGKYTAIFHADDVYEPDMVAKQVAFLEEHPDAGAVFTEASIIDGMSKKIGEMHLPKGVCAIGGLYDFPSMFKAVLRHSNFFICPSVMVRTQIYQDEIKGWRGELFKSSADLDLWLRILQRHPIGYLQEPLIRYRISDNQWSAKIRLGTNRADFFLVTDHYLAQETVRVLLDDNDIANYQCLDRRDRVMRAINLFITGNAKQANELIHDIYSWKAIKSGFQSKRGAFVLLLGIYVKLLAFFKFSRIGVLSLTYMKQVTHK